MKEIRSRKGSAGVLLTVLILAAAGFLGYVYIERPSVGIVSMKNFESCNAIVNAFKTSQLRGAPYGMMERALGAAEMMAPMAAKSSAGIQYSATNIQVAGVDEADIVKTDGEYIYTLSDRKLIIAKAYPPEDAEVLSETGLELEPREMFIGDGTLLVFGYTRQEIPLKGTAEPKTGKPEEIYPYYNQITTVQLWNIKDRSDPKLVRSVDFEGSYLSSRKIGSDVYFVINSYPNYRIMEERGSPVPLYRDRTDDELDEEKGFVQTSRCDEVSYFEPIMAERFVTIASIPMDDPEGEIKKEVIVGSGQNIYSSRQNLYIAEYQYYWEPVPLKGAGNSGEKTIVHKFSLGKGNINYKGHMEVPGRVLNQFSMDEYNGYFRIATTKGRVSRAGGSSSNNLYIYNDKLNLTGSLEDLAPGESIHSARFMGDRAYLVTFKKIDPLFAIDLSDPANPRVLGKLKIPGYSDYLHPYDENHLIGIGKETVEAEEVRGDFAWYQGVKMAIFDVTDVENPKELHKVVIGDRGTDSEVLRDHKAFLFDRDKHLLVLPILLAEIKGGSSPSPNTYGEYVYQGAYVYTLTLENGFELKGRITHYETDESFKKSGYYFRGDASVKRALYIDDVLYTISQKKIKLNQLADMEEIKELVFGA
jgi:uncharacterized secreted protein with C-terminal beta-propeller domain